MLTWEEISEVSTKELLVALFWGLMVKWVL